MENKPQAKWWDDMPTAPTKPIKNDSELSQKKFQTAKDKYEAMCSVYEQKKLQEHNGKWMRSLISSGTYSDKIKALALIIQSGPFNTYNYLVQLMGHCNKKNKDESELAIKATKELFQNYLLPKRNLFNFQHQNFEIATPYILAKYYFEHCVKQAFNQFIEILRRASMENVSKFKLNAIKCCSELAAAVVEQRGKLIGVVVNKLGDTSGNIVKKVNFYISELIKRYKDTINDIINSIRELIVRSNVNDVTVRRAMTCLNGVTYTKNEPERAENMMSLLIVYFTSVMKEENIKKMKKDEFDNRMIQSIIIGIRNCHKYCRSIKQIEDKLDDMYKIVRLIPLNRALECLSLLGEIDKSKRFTRIVYEKINDILTIPMNKQFIFLMIIKQHLMEQENLDLVASFVRKLLIQSLCATPSFICSVLSLVSELLNKFKLLRGMFDNNSNLDDEDEHYNDIEEDEDGKEFVRNETESTKVEFDIAKRSPEYSNAINTKCYEITLLLHHYHPVVRAFVSNLITNKPIRMNGEIWESISLKTLYNRFALKKLKKETPEDEENEDDDNKDEKHIVFDDDNKGKKGKKNAEEEKEHRIARENEIRLMVVNSEEFLDIKRESIPLECVFFYDYYTDKRVEKELETKKKKKDEDEEEMSVEDDSDGMSEDLEEDEGIIYEGMHKEIKDEVESEEDEKQMKEIAFEVGEEDIYMEEENDFEKTMKKTKTKSKKKDDSDEYDYDDIMDYGANELLGMENDQLENEEDMSIEEGNVIDEEDDAPE